MSTMMLRQESAQLKPQVLYGQLINIKELHILIVNITRVRIIIFSREEFQSIILVFFREENK